MYTAAGPRKEFLDGAELSWTCPVNIVDTKSCRPANQLELLDCHRLYHSNEQKAWRSKGMKMSLKCILPSYEDILATLIC